MRYLVPVPIGGTMSRLPFVRSRAFWLALSVVALALVVGSINPAFVEYKSFVDRLATLAPVLILSIGVGVVVLTGEIDISVGAMYGTLAALLGVLSSPTHAGWHPAGAVAAVIAAGAGIGLVNGLVTVLGRVPSIVTTLGTMSILHGVTIVMLGGNWIKDMPEGLRAIGAGQVGGVPVPVIAAAAVVAAGMAVARCTRMGVKIYATGDNPSAAALSRVNTAAVRVLAFVLSGGLVGVAVTFGVTQLSTIESNLGQGYELAAVTAVVVGGVSIRGGRGRLEGVAAAAVLLKVVASVLIFLKLGLAAAYWERGIQGVCILAAVVADRWTAGGRPAQESQGSGGHGPIPIAAVLAVLMAVAWWNAPRFVSFDAQTSLLTQLAEVALLATPMMLVVLTGGIDLSVGSAMALAAVTAGLLNERGVAWPVCAASAVGVGGVCGLLNGLLVTRGRVHPLVVTLATMALFRGLAEGISLARPISGFSETWTDFGDADLAGVPAVMVPAAIAAAAAAFVLARTTWGLRLRAIGVNETAARYCGVGVDRLKTAAYTLSGAAAGLAACLFIAVHHTAKADVGTGIELEVITACVLGGVSLAGGRGGVGGVVVGVLLLHELRQFVRWQGVHDEIILIVLGSVLIASVLAGHLARLSRFRSSR